ncbi:hypothetical protein ACO1PK_01075 [Alishewanella sp. d11]|uniref:hypothetical protein n=1 Tax=Alishewanella sp. d11 TaxID=3414030 RepID=UPI003BF89400
MLGKIIGFVIGIALFKLPGAIIGVLVGHYIDKLSKKNKYAKLEHAETEIDTEEEISFKSLDPLTVNQYELVIKGSKLLENILKTRFSAEGKGLHEYTTSIENQLPQALTKKLRWIASVRNQFVHSNAIIDCPAEFFDAVTSCINQLKKIEI